MLGWLPGKRPKQSCLRHSGYRESKTVSSESGRTASVGRKQIATASDKFLVLTLSERLDFTGPMSLRCSEEGESERKTFVSPLKCLEGRRVLFNCTPLMWSSELCTRC